VEHSSYVEEGSASYRPHSHGPLHARVQETLPRSLSDDPV
jgi:predicted membrane-bound mannosyltransferase